MKDNFLNRTSAEMLTCTEDIIAYDLGYPFSKQDYNAKLIENIVKENFESFFKFYNSDLNLLIQYYLKIILIQY